MALAELSTALSDDKEYLWAPLQDLWFFDYSHIFPLRVDDLWNNTFFPVQFYTVMLYRNFWSIKKRPKPSKLLSLIDTHFTIDEFFLPYTFSIHYKLFILCILGIWNFLLPFDNVGSFVVFFFCAAAKAADSKPARYERDFNKQCRHIRLFLHSLWVVF